MRTPKWRNVRHLVCSIAPLVQDRFVAFVSRWFFGAFVIFGAGTGSVQRGGVQCTKYCWISPGGVSPPRPGQI